MLGVVIGAALERNPMALFQERKLSTADAIGIIIMMTGIYFAREYWHSKPVTETQSQEVQKSQP